MKKMETANALNLNLYCCMYSGCENEYSSKFNLKRHVESVHMHVKRFKCPACHVFYSSKQSLQEHLHTHTGVMPFKCELCEKYFRQASQLSLHKRVHMLEGKNSNFVKVQMNESFCEIKPIEVCMEVDKGKLKLPIISEKRKGLALLPRISYSNNILTTTSNM